MSTWADNWLPRDEMLRPYGCLVQNPLNLVSELIICTSASLNSERTEHVFMPMDKGVVLGIPLCTCNLPDFWACNFEEHELFTVKSAYMMLTTTKLSRKTWLEGYAGSYSINKEGNTWKLMWKPSVPSNIRMFLWWLSKYSLPTNDV